MRPYIRAARRRLSDRRFVSPLRVDPEAPALLLSPHLDDAVLDCFSELAGGEPLVVVTVFAGIPADGVIPGWDRICGATDIKAHLRERMDEDREALATLGREAVALPLLGQNYRGGGPRPALRDLGDLIARHAPAASRVLAPAMVGEPIPDHLFVRGFALALHRQGMPVTLYADIPYATQFGWPHWVTGTDRNPRIDVDVFWSRFLAQVPGIEGARTRVLALTPDEAARKLETMRMYRTQFEGLDAVGKLSDPTVHGFEVYWDLRNSE
jgi:LmbE family N-acetylglucosaminyl deacetylase